MTGEIDRRPTRVGTFLAVGLALVVVATSVSVSVLGVVLAAVGVAAMGAGMIGGWRGIVDVAGLVLVGAVLATALVSPGPSQSILTTVAILGGAVASVGAWDVGTNAIDLGQQLGRESDTTRTELFHAGATLLIGVAVAGVSVVGFQVLGGRYPISALAVMLVAMLVLVSALRI